MDIQAEKLNLMKMILETKDASIIQSIKELFKNEAKSDFWDELSADQKMEIQQGIKEVENGETIAFDDLLKSHKI